MDMYNCELVGIDADIMIAAVNKGIDARLRAVTDSTFEWRVHYTDGSHSNTQHINPDKTVFTGKLHCVISRDDLVTILYRLYEWPNVDELEPYSLAGSILSTFGFDDFELYADDSVSWYDYEHTESDKSFCEAKSLDEMLADVEL